MYILINDNNNPFAIVKDNTNMRIEKATSEEYNYHKVSFTGEIILPDFGETKTLNFTATDENGFEYHESIKVTKPVSY